MSDQLHDNHILSAVAELTSARGYPPTFRELAQRLERNHSTIFARVDKLRKKGFLELGRAKSPGFAPKTRGLRLTKEGWAEIGQEAIPLSALPRVKYLPVFHSVDGLNRYLAIPGHRENVAAASALANREARFIPIAELRSPENMPPSGRTRAKPAAPSFQFQRRQKAVR